MAEFDAAKIAREIVGESDNPSLRACLIEPLRASVAAALQSAFDAGRLAGAEEMRERAAKICEDMWDGGGDCCFSFAAETIRALQIDPAKGE